MKKKKWTYNGIKAYYPHLSGNEWFGICRRKDHLHEDRYAVIARVNWRNG